MTWVAAGGAAASLLGNGIGALGGASAAREKNRLLAQGQQEQARAGGEAAGVMGDFLAKLRASTPNPAAERGAFTGAIGPQRVSGPITASRQFQTDAGGATTAAHGYGNQVADWLAQIRAPALQRNQESQLLQNAGNALKPIQMRANNQDFMTQFRAGQVKENPLYSLASQGLQGVGNYAMANPGAAAKMLGIGG